MPTSIRLPEDLDDRLTEHIEHSGVGLQPTIEAAINAYCDHLTPPIPAQMSEDADTKVPRDPHRELPGTPKDEAVRLAVVRLKPNTRARLAAACKQQNMGGKDFITEAVETYLDRFGE